MLSTKNDLKYLWARAIAIFTLVIIALLAVMFAPQNSRVRGIDVSRWQGQIDWDKVAKSGIKFAFIKATEGSDYVDPYFEINLKRASAAGILVGAYHYAHPSGKALKNIGIEADAIVEAAHFVHIAGKAMQAGNLRPALDLEINPENMTRKQLSKWVNTFAATVKLLTDTKIFIYTYAWFADTFLDKSITKHTLWFARYNDQNAQIGSPNDTRYRLGPWRDWAIWQHSNTGSVPGIKDDVDLDVAHGKAQFISQFIIHKQAG